MEIAHTAIWVSDLDRITDFYENVFGLEPSLEFEEDDGVQNYFVQGETAAEIQFKYDPDSSGDISTDCVAHIAIVVENFDEIIAAIEADSAATIDEGPMADNDHRKAFGTDPEGYGIEIIEDH